MTETSSAEISHKCQTDQNRADYMEYLFNLYERDSDKVPLGLRNTFTGLAEQHRLHLGKIVMDAQVEDWHVSAKKYKSLDATHPPKT